MSTTLYSLEISHPAKAAKLMLRQAGVEFTTVELVPGLHPPVLFALGFRGRTVPALKLEGRRVQGTLAISRALDRVAPDAGLFPADPAQRAAVEEAERWGEGELQGVPRRVFRWAMTKHREVRTFAAKTFGLPAPGITGWSILPAAAVMARLSRATDETVRADLAALPAQLDHVDALIEQGVIGGRTSNAADFQLATTVRTIAAFGQLKPLVDGRPADELARRIWPRFPVGRAPAVLPAEWIPSAA